MKRFLVLVFLSLGLFVLWGTSSIRGVDVDFRRSLLHVAEPRLDYFDFQLNYRGLAVRNWSYYPVTEEALDRLRFNSSFGKEGWSVERIPRHYVHFPVSCVVPRLKFDLGKVPDDGVRARGAQLEIPWWIPLTAVTGSNNATSSNARTGARASP